MDKLAQKRRLNWMNRIREDFDPFGKLTENKSEEFSRLMEILREVDEKVREIALTDEDGKGSLKSLIKVARSNFNRREYINTVIYLGRFHDKLSDIKSEFGKLQNDLTKAHNEFLFGDLDPEQIEFLMKRMPEKFKPKPKSKDKKASIEDQLIKEAGLSDWWHNMTTDRGKALKAWEKRFPQFAKQLKKDTEKMINRSEVIFQTLVTTLKSLAQHRGKRQLEEYNKTADQFVKKYDQYDDFFNDYYNSHVAKLIETQRGLTSEKELKKLDEEAEKVLNEDANAPVTEVTPVNVSETPAPAVEPVNLPAQPTPVEEAVVTPKKTPPPPSGSGGTPADFPKPPNSSDMRLDDEIINKMQDLEKQMGVSQPAASAQSRALSKPHSSALVHTRPEWSVDLSDLEPSTRPEWSVDLTDLEPSTQKVPSMPYTQTSMPSTKVPVSSSGIRHKTPSVNLVAPQFPKAPKVPQNLFPKNTPTLPAGPIEEEPKTIRSTSEQFIAELSSFSNENPLVLANKIVKFANSIAVEDKATSEKLLSIAKNIISKL